MLSLVCSPSRLRLHASHSPVGPGVPPHAHLRWSRTVWPLSRATLCRDRLLAGPDSLAGSVARRENISVHCSSSLRMLSRIRFLVICGAGPTHRTCHGRLFFLDRAEGKRLQPLRFVDGAFTKRRVSRGIRRRASRPFY